MSAVDIWSKYGFVNGAAKLGKYYRPTLLVFNYYANVNGMRWYYFDEARIWALRAVKYTHLTSRWFIRRLRDIEDVGCSMKKCLDKWRNNLLFIRGDLHRNIRLKCLHAESAVFSTPISAMSRRWFNDIDCADNSENWYHCRADGGILSYFK